MLDIKKINLDNNNPDVTLIAFVTDIEEKPRDAMIVFPGGAYTDLSPREEAPVALSFYARGMAAFALRYTVCPDDPYKPLIDASRAVSYVKEHAKEFNVNPDRVFVCGFSAGGHLAASIGSLWHNKTLIEKSGVEYGANKPAGTVLCYPVISLDENITHKGSLEKLLGEHNEDKEYIDLFSIDKQVSSKTVPAFIIHTVEDMSVSLKNPLKMAEALYENNILFEMHIYPKGPHGLSLANLATKAANPEYIDEPYSRWVDDVMLWIKRF